MLALRTVTYCTENEETPWGAFDRAVSLAVSGRVHVQSEAHADWLSSPAFEGELVITRILAGNRASVWPAVATVAERPFCVNGAS